jgi:hypothetical protein
MLRLGNNSQEAVDKLETQSIHMWPAQKNQVKLPSDISNVSSEELSNLFTKLTAWSNYVSTQLAAAQIDEKALEKKIEFHTNTLLVTRMKKSEKGETVTMIKAEISLDPTIVELEQSLLEQYAYRKMVEVVANNIERDISLISREITRRSYDGRSVRKDRYTL